MKNKNVLEVVDVVNEDKDVEYGCWLDAVENYQSDWDINGCKSFAYYTFSNSPYRCGRSLSVSDDVSKNTDYLVGLIQSGVDDDERDDIIEAIIADNFKLLTVKVRSLLPKTYSNNIIDVEDVVQKVVNEYVSKIYTYDPSKGYSFNTYAAGFLGSRAKDFVDDNKSYSKMSGATYSEAIRYTKEYQAFREETGRNRKDFVEMVSKRDNIGKKTLNQYLDTFIGGAMYPVHLDSNYDYYAKQCAEYSLDPLNVVYNDEIIVDLNKFYSLKGKAKKEFIEELRIKYADRAA